MIYKKYIFGPSDDQIYFSFILGLNPQFLAYCSPNPWNFLNVENDNGVFCCVNEVTREPSPPLPLLVIKPQNTKRIISPTLQFYNCNFTKNIYNFSLLTVDKSIMSV